MFVQVFMFVQSCIRVLANVSNRQLMYLSTWLLLLVIMLFEDNISTLIHMYLPEKTIENEVTFDR